MKNNKAIWIVGLFLLAAALVNAGSYNPETYWGYVYIEGTIAPSSTLLTLESTNTGEIFSSQTLPYDAGYPGSYSIILEFDDAYTGADEGANINEALTWRVNGIPAINPSSGTDIAETGKTNNNFRIDAISTPALDAILNQSATSINLGSSLILSVLLNNTGSGSGNATLASLSDLSLNSDLPKTVWAARNNTNQTTATITSATCGQKSPNLTINYYNLIGALVGTLNKQFSFSVTGADLILSSINVSNTNPTAGESVSVTSTLLNNGTVNITGFTARFYYNSNLIATINSNDTLDANESVGLSANWNAIIGATSITAEIATSGTECYSTNNNILIPILVKDATNQTSASGLGGGGGSGGAGTNTEMQCSDGFDNDGDNLVDYPNDTGCESASDDDETDTIEYPEVAGGGLNSLNKTSEEEPKETEPEKDKGGFSNTRLGKTITGFVVMMQGDGANLVLNMLLLLLILAVSVYIFTKRSQKKKAGMNKEERGIQEQKKVIIPPLSGERVRVVIHPKENWFIPKNAQKQESQSGRQIISQKREEPALIQKSIKISSKKEIIDRIKEVHEENG